MAEGGKNPAEQAIKAMEELVQERDQYHELYLEERITGLGAQITLAEELKRQAEQELEVLKK